MSLQAVTHLNVDFCDKKYILINAKQYDKNSRFILITCYNHGEVLSIDQNEYSAYIRYRKPNDVSTFVLCEINSNGEILVELTEQMLNVDGICYADLVIVSKEDVNVNVDTGEISVTNESSILSTMVFCIDVSASPIEYSEIEASSEFTNLNDLLEKASADYNNIIQMSKSYAVGGTGVRENEDEDNAKYWAERAHVFATGDISNSVVTGIKIGNDTTYRTGRVDINVEKLGAIPIADIATVDEVAKELNIELNI